MTTFCVTRGLRSGAEINVYDKKTYHFCQRTLNFTARVKEVFSAITAPRSSTMNNTP